LPIEEGSVEELGTDPVDVQRGVSQLEKLSLEGSETFDVLEDRLVYNKHSLNLSNKMWRLRHVPSHFYLAVYNGGIGISNV
jgi:hypothetical protein